MPINTARYTELAGKMLDLYTRGELDLIALLKKLVGVPPDDINVKQWALKKFAESDKARLQLVQMLNSVTEQRIDALNNMIQQAYTDAGMQFLHENRIIANDFGITHISPNSLKAATIAGELNSGLDAADRLILRKVDDMYANVVANVTARAASGHITVRQAVSEEVMSLARNGIVSFTDKAGRNWDMGSYCEMATLTGIERATRYGYVDTMQDYSFDLAKISSHEGACPLCAAWENVVVSVSGTNPNYPSLADAEAGGCFHPRCLHNIDTYYEGVSDKGRNSPRPVQPASDAYSTRQKQRYYERQLRKWKREVVAASDPQEQASAYRKVQQYDKAVQSLVDDYNARTPYERDYLRIHRERQGGGSVNKYLSKEAKNILARK